MMEHGGNLVVWSWVLLASGGLALAVIIDRLAWPEPYRRPASPEPLVRIQGWISESPGTVVYCVDGGDPIISQAFRVTDRERRTWVVDPTGAVLAIRGYRSGKRHIRGLVAGEAVTIDGVATTLPTGDGLYRDAGRVQGIEAVRIAGGGWPELRWLRVPLALAVVLCLVSLGHVLVAPGPTPLRSRIARSLMQPPACGAVGGASFTFSKQPLRLNFTDDEIHGLGRLIGDHLGQLPPLEDRLIYRP